MSKYLVIITILGFSIMSCKKSSIENNIEQEKIYKIGDTAFGGVIFYLNNSNEHGLVCSLTDLGSQIKWDFSSVINNVYVPRRIGATDTAFGAGFSNTNKIIAVIGNGNNAASLCRRYNGGGFTDWFLPSRNELYEFYRNLNWAGWRASCGYWSSTETFSGTTSSNAELVGGCFGIYTQVYMKYYETNVRAIRAF